VAADTAMLIIEDFQLEGLAFGVGTPGTAQGAAFEKDHRSYAWTVMSREALDVKDYSHRENTIRLFSFGQYLIPFVSITETSGMSIDRRQNR
jgi:hypothetical protein